jgi:predicted RNase H-like nuclease
MQVGYQVGQVVLRGSVELHQQWRDHLEVQDPWDAQSLICGFIAANTASVATVGDE